MSHELQVEWRQHAANYSTTWLASMRAAGRIEEVGDVHDAELRKALHHHSKDPQRSRMLKDAHLIETARRAERLVCSGDETVRKDFRQHTKAVTQLAPIVWVNPRLPADEPIRWLMEGAKNHSERRLDHEAEA